MQAVIGFVVALLLLWPFAWIGGKIQKQTGIQLGRLSQIFVAVGVALVIWLALQATTSLPRTIIDMAGFGPALGLTMGLRGRAAPSRK